MRPAPDPDSEHGFASVNLEDDDEAMVDMLFFVRQEGGSPVWGVESENIPFNGSISFGHPDPRPPLADIIRAWLSEHLEDPDSTTARLQSIRAKVEALIGALQLGVLENLGLQEQLDEKEYIVAQLRAQVETLETELRRKTFSTRRVGFCSKLIVEILLTAAAAYGGGAGYAVAEHRPATPVVQTQTRSGEIFRQRVRECEQLNAEIRAYENDIQPQTIAPTGVPV
jgi:hypothetical protein